MKFKSNPPFLSLVDASFRLGDRLVFENSTWTFGQGEHWAVLGGNGSGKSLFADALCGHFPLVNGELRYHFRPPPGLSPEEAIGVVSFEQRKADLRQTVVQSRWNSIEEEAASLVRDFLSYERTMEVNPFEVTDRHDKARPAFERRMRDAIALLGIEPFLDRRLISLSNGETQRVQLARALSRPLRMLILDDPFVGLDAAARDRFHVILERLMGTPLRVMLITNRVEDLPRRITHVMVLNQCRILTAGTRAKVLSEGGVRRFVPAFPTHIGNGANKNSAQIFPTPKPKPAPAKTPVELVRLRDVSARYGTATVLDRVNWTIRSGESWALLGPNGSGKTTLLSLILGDNPQVYVNDIVVFGQQRGNGESIWEIKRRIGWVSPELHLHFNGDLSCFEVVASGFYDTIGLFDPLSASRKRATRELLARFDLLKYADTPLSALSAGLQRMVLLARALVKKPRLLILDEPCQGLDRGHREFFVCEVDKLVREGLETVIYVTHRRDELPRSIRRVIKLSKGREH